MFDGFAHSVVERVGNCHWTRAMENALRGVHLPFVHRATWVFVLPIRRQPQALGGLSRA